MASSGPVSGHFTMGMVAIEPQNCQDPGRRERKCDPLCLARFSGWLSGATRPLPFLCTGSLKSGLGEAT
jgi:hypothetical protein